MSVARVTARFALHAKRGRQAVSETLLSETGAAGASPPAFGPNWKSVDEINADAGDWNLVTNRADVMAEFPGYNAIIMCIGRFYLVVLEGGAA